MVLKFRTCILLFNSLIGLTISTSCKPLIVAHRGASGYVPEHTLGAYALAITMGADYVEPDLVMTKDGHLIARHENELSVTTDVNQRPEFANRRRTQLVSGTPITGWFSEDFTLNEVKTLRSTESMPTNRPGNARMDRSFEIPTMQEIIDLVKSMEVSEKRTIGLCPEIKSATHFQRIGLGMERPLVDVLHKNGYRGRDAPVCIQSFEVTNLKELRNMTDLTLTQLISNNRALPPYDQLLQGNLLTYGQMATPEGLRDIAKYADTVGPDKRYVIPRDSNDRLGEPTSFVADAHAVGLEVHPYTFRSENRFLPREYRSENTAAYAIGDMKGELQAYINTGIDGFFVDQPDIAMRLRAQCLQNNNN